MLHGALEGALSTTSDQGKRARPPLAVQGNTKRDQGAVEDVGPWRRGRRCCAICSPFAAGTSKPDRVKRIRVTCPTCEVLLEVQPAEGSRVLIGQVVTCTCGVKLKVGRLVNAGEAAAP